MKKITEGLKKYNLEYKFKSIPFRTDWEGDANHYAITIKRDGKKIQILYSQGFGITHKPKLEDVMYSLLMDSYDLDSYESWCDSLGYDTDSIRALETFQACEKEYKQLLNMFTMDEMDELRTLFEDY